MNKQAFCNALSAAFGESVTCPENFWNFSVEVDKEAKWIFVLAADYSEKIQRGKNSDNDVARLRELSHGKYLLRVDPSLPSNGSKGNDVLIVPL